MTGDVELCDDGRTTVKFKKGAPGDFPGGPVIKTSPSNAGGAVRFLAGELRSHMPPGQKKDQNIKLNHFAVHWKLTQYCKSALLQYKIKIKLKKGRGIKLQRLVGASLL